jgi:hypothetical protein
MRTGESACDKRAGRTPAVVPYDLSTELISWCFGKQEGKGRRTSNIACSLDISKGPAMLFFARGYTDNDRNEVQGRLVQTLQQTYHP